MRNAREPQDDHREPTPIVIDPVFMIYLMDRSGVLPRNNIDC